MLRETHRSKGTAPKVSKGRLESPLGSEAFAASGAKEKAERVSRNEQPLAAAIEAADAPACAALNKYRKSIGAVLLHGGRPLRLSKKSREVSEGSQAL